MAIPGLEKGEIMYYEFGLLDYLTFIPVIVITWCLAIILIFSIIKETIKYFKKR